MPQTNFNKWIVKNYYCKILNGISKLQLKKTHQQIYCYFIPKIETTMKTNRGVALLQAVVSSVNKYFRKLLQDKRYNLFE